MYWSAFLGTSVCQVANFGRECVAGCILGASVSAYAQSQVAAFRWFLVCCNLAMEHQDTVVTSMSASTVRNIHQTCYKIIVLIILKAIVA